MKISEKIIRFADGEMSHAEKKEFEKELENSPALRDELNSYNSLLSKAEEIQYVPADENYFISIIPNFRIRQSKKSRLNIYSILTIGSSLAAVLVLFFIFFNKGSGQLATKTEFADYKPGEIDSMLNYYPQNYTELDSVIANNKRYGEVVDSMLYSEFNVAEDNIELISSNLPLDYSQNFVNNINISDKEADVIYNEILKKDFF